MGRRRKKRSQKSGLAPGTLVHIGEPRTGRVKVTLVDYDESQLQEREITNLSECRAYRDKASVTWINVDGVHDLTVVEEIGRQFDLHPLLLEDVVNTDQRPKLDDFGNYVLVVLKMLSYHEEAREVVSEQVSMILGARFLLSFQEERAGDVFDPVRERFRSAKGRIRKLGTDYLAYALIDAVVDHYFLILEKVGDRIESLEEDLIQNPRPETLKEIYHLKREMIALRRAVWPLREVVNGLERLESELISEPTRVFLRDVYDHVIQVIDEVETFREMLAGMLEMYLSSISNRMNEIMKVLTIISTVFIPLTFIAGIYGMNFEHMPELKWEWGYYGVMGIMGVIGLVMLLYFRRKRWI